MCDHSFFLCIHYRTNAVAAAAIQQAQAMVRDNCSNTPHCETMHILFFFLLCHCTPFNHPFPFPPNPHLFPFPSLPPILNRIWQLQLGKRVKNSSNSNNIIHRSNKWTCTVHSLHYREDGILYMYIPYMYCVWHVHVNVLYGSACACFTCNVFVTSYMWQAQCDRVCYIPHTLLLLHM